MSSLGSQVVNISQASFSRKIRRDRKRDSGIPAKDPVDWAEFKKTLPEELSKTLDGEDFCRLN